MAYVIKEMPPQVDARLIEKLGRCETATIGHVRQLGFVHRAVQAVPARGSPAPPSHWRCRGRILGLLRPGDVLVVDRLGDDKHACFGGGTAAAAKASGAAAVVVDGPCADFSEIRGHGLPVWCRGPAPITTRRYDIGGACNVPICCGGAAVLPGCAVLADEGGVLVLPPGEIEAIADRAIEKLAGEPESHRQMLEEGLRIGDLSGASALVKANLADWF